MLLDDELCDLIAVYNDVVQYVDRCVKSQVNGREFAVKKLADLETTSSARRVYNELCALSHLKHENVRHVFYTVDRF